MTVRVGCKAALIVGLCSPSLAASEREPIRLSYVAHAGCPAAKDFEASVLERTSRARPAGSREIAREYRIAVRLAEKKSVARLEFAEAGGGTVAREVTYDDCGEAVRAIALVTALAIDAVVAAGAKARSDASNSSHDDNAAHELTGQQTSLPLAATNQTAGPSSEAPPRPPEKRKPPARSPRPRDVTSDPERDARSARPDTTPSQKPELELGARATLTSAKAPRLLPNKP